ncbi:MAG: HU family DNA-binding protein [Cytophagales bacterium]|nr:HU family DNA-binding protein [Cytophagales bacterium]
MALQYEVKSKRPGLSRDQPAKYYPVLTGRKVADTRLICDHISAGSSLTRSDVLAVITALTDLIPELLEDGYNVKLEDLGTFSLHARSEGKEDPTKVTVRDIKSLKMAFLPSKQIKEALKTLKVEKKK